MKKKLVSLLLCLAMVLALLPGSAMAAAAVNGIDLTLKAPDVNQMPTEASVPETASTVVTNTRWVGRVWRKDGKFSGPSGYGAYVTLRIKDSVDRLFHTDPNRYTITINGNRSGADIGPYKAETYLLSVSEDRKQAEVFVSFDMNVVALGVTGGHKILKAGDPLAREATEERTDQTMDNITVRSIPESPDGTVQPYSWVITEMDVHAKEGYLLTSLESAKKKVGTTEAFNRYESLGLVADLEYQDPFNVHVTFYQWIGPAEGETLTDQMKKQAEEWRAGHAGKYADEVEIGTGKLQDYLAPRLSKEGKLVDDQGNFHDLRAYAYSVPSMAAGSDKWVRVADTVTILDDHAETKFPGAVGRWYLIRQGAKVGYIPAAYLKDTAAGNSPADPGTATGTKIKNVALAMTPLQEGKSLPTDLKVSSPSGVSVTNLQWYGGESGKLSNTTKVETGKTYVISFTISANKGMELGNTSQLQVTVNGQKALYTTGDKTSGDYQAVFYFEKPVEYAPDAKRAEKEDYDTFDYRAYANIYPDLKAAYGYDAEKLYAHYVNYGKAEGRVGTFISGDNPKTNAPIYGIVPIPKGATLPATLLDPLPPKDPSKQAKWSEETTNYLSWSNAKLVAEYYSMKSIMDGEQRWDYLTDITVYYWQSTLPDELQDRYDAVVENDPNFFSTHGDVYGRAMQSDTRILYQFFNGYKDFAPPPADPGTPGNPPAASSSGSGSSGDPQGLSSAALGLKVSGWAKANVDKAIAAGLYDEVLGKDLTQPVTRAQAAAIAVKIYLAMGGKDTDTQTVSFSDTKDSKVLKAAELGLVSGSNGKFDPDGGFNRESIAMILGNVYKKVNGTVPNVTATKFTDNAKISSWARPAVAFMNEKGIVNGSGGAFDPKGAITGEGMLMMGIGMMEKLAKK